MALGLGTAIPSGPLAAPGPTHRDRVRPGRPDWPDEAAWQGLNTAVGGALVKVASPFAECIAAPHPTPPACEALFKAAKQPVGARRRRRPDPDLRLGRRLDARRRASTPSPRAAPPTSSPRSTSRASSALRLVVKGGGHSYQGTSNAADSLLVWTRRMNDGRRCTTRSCRQGCAGRVAPARAVTLGAGAIWAHVYDAVTTRGGGYVQGGGCTTVGVAGLVQSGGFGSFSKRVRPRGGEPARSRGRHRRRRGAHRQRLQRTPISSGR